MSFREAETEFRFYWLQTKLKEVEGASSVSALNPFKFVILSKHECSRPAISAAVTSLPSEQEVSAVSLRC